MSRQTIPTLTVLERGNRMLRESNPDAIAERVATAALMETLLHAADAYAGFTYLPSACVNYEAIERGEGFQADDESRRLYHTHAKLRTRVTR